LWYSYELIIFIWLNYNIWSLLCFSVRSTYGNRPDISGLLINPSDTLNLHLYCFQYKYMYSNKSRNDLYEITICIIVSTHFLFSRYYCRDFKYSQERKLRYSCKCLCIVLNSVYSTYHLYITVYLDCVFYRTVSQWVYTMLLWYEHTL